MDDRSLLRDHHRDLRDVAVPTHAGARAADVVGVIMAGGDAYGFTLVVSAGLVWQIRRWRPIPGAPDPPVTPGGA
ncbi:MAG: hypothetical protein LBS56_05570 [Propionibacteriaceae bacterium]|nr:hypothetical protein [Propionibacteriaceae bacterium]